MKIFTSQKLLFTLIVSSVGFMAVGCDRSTSSSQYKTEPGTRQQQGYGRAPHPPLTNLQTGTRQQQGYGRAPHSPINPK